MSGNTRAILYRLAWIFMLIAIVIWAVLGIAVAISESDAMGLLLWIPLVWLVPMTIFTGNAYKNAGFMTETGHTALGILEMIFGGFVAGILVVIAASGFAAINRSESTVTVDSTIDDIFKKD